MPQKKRKRQLLKESLVSHEDHKITKILVLFIGLIILATAFFQLGVYAHRIDIQLFPKLKIAPKSETQLLFVLNGDMTIAEDKLTVKDEKIEWFTDRPDRDAGFMDAASFIELWNESDFVLEAPNAAFSNLSAVIELKSPVLKNKSIEFDFEVVSGKLGDGEIKDASLYIDAYPTAVNSQITDAVTQSSYGDGLCWFDAAPWQVVGTVKYLKETTNCDTWNPIMESFLNQVEEKAYFFSINVTANYPQQNTQWLCVGRVEAFNEVSPWQMSNVNCDPVDATLKNSYGLEIDGQTSLK